MKNKFKYFEYVKVISKDFEEILDLEGGIIGISNDSKNYYYGVLINNQTYLIEESALESTGKFGRREDFYI